MLASSGTGARRLRLARDGGVPSELRARLSDHAVGIASFTDRVLPHLFPSANGRCVRATVERVDRDRATAARVELPTNATSIDSLAAVRSQRFFAPRATQRMLIVLTDGESQSRSTGLGSGALHARLR